MGIISDAVYASVKYATIASFIESVEKGLVLKLFHNIVNELVCSIWSGYQMPSSSVLHISIWLDPTFDGFLRDAQIPSVDCVFLGREEYFE